MTNIDTLITNIWKAGDSMSDNVITVLLSGQLLLVIWEIVKGISNHREKVKRSLIQDDDLRKMVFRLYKDNLKHRIIDLFKKVDDKNIDIRADLMDLHDDVEIYFKNGGNGTVKKLYVHLSVKVREVRGEAEFSLMYVEDIDSGHHQG